jgi:hypothetical protein
MAFGAGCSLAKTPKVGTAALLAGYGLALWLVGAQKAGTLGCRRGERLWLVGAGTRTRRGLHSDAAGVSFDSR